METSYHYLQRAGTLIARFLDESLSATLGDAAAKVAVDVLRQDSSSAKTLRQDGFSNLDLSGTLDVFLSLLFLKVDDLHYDVRKPWFEALGFLGTSQDVYSHPERRRLYRTLENLRAARNELSHEPVGVTEQHRSRKQVSHLQSLATILTLLSSLTLILEKRPALCSADLRRDIDDLFSEVQQLVTLETKDADAGRYGTLWKRVVAAFILITIAVAIAALFLPSKEQPEEHSNVLLVVLSPPPNEAIDSLLAVIERDTLEVSTAIAHPGHSSVVFRVITERGIGIDSLIVDVGELHSSDVRIKLAALVRDAQEISSVRAVPDVYEYVRQALARARTTEGPVMVVTIGTSGRGLDEQFIADYNSGVWHATPRGFFDAWNTLREQQRFARPLYVFPAAANSLDSALCASFALEGYAANSITVPTWIIP